MSKPEKSAGQFRLLKSLLLLVALAILAFLAVSPPASSLDAEDTAQQAPATVAAEDAPTKAPDEVQADPASPESGTGQADAGGEAPAAEVPTAEAPAGEAPSSVTTDKSSGSPAAGGSVAARVPVPAAEKEKAATALRAYVGKAASTLATAKTPAADELEALAVGPAQGAILADAAEFESNGWRQEGAPTVAELEVVKFDGSASPQRMTVNACVDSSKVKVITAEGAVIRQGTASSRSLNVLSLVKAGSGGWLVEEVSFPDDPTC